MRCQRKKAEKALNLRIKQNLGGAELKIDFQRGFFLLQSGKCQEMGLIGTGVARLHSVVLLFPPGFLNLLQIKFN